MLDASTRKWDITMDAVDVHTAKDFVLTKRPEMRVFNDTLAQMIVDSLELDFPIPQSRKRIVFEPGDRVMVASYDGPRFGVDRPAPEIEDLNYWELELNLAD